MGRASPDRPASPAGVIRRSSARSASPAGLLRAPAVTSRSRAKPTVDDRRPAAHPADGSPVLLLLTPRLAPRAGASSCAADRASVLARQAYSRQKDRTPQGGVEMRSYLVV